MKSQVLHTVWCSITGVAAGWIWTWSLLGVKGFNTRKPFKRMPPSIMARVYWQWPVLFTHHRHSFVGHSWICFSSRHLIMHSVIHAFIHPYIYWSYSFCPTGEGCNPNQQVDQEKGKSAMHAAAAADFIDILGLLRNVGSVVLFLSAIPSIIPTQFL